MYHKPRKGPGVLQLELRQSVSTSERLIHHTKMGFDPPNCIFIINLNVNSYAVHFLERRTTILTLTVAYFMVNAWQKILQTIFLNPSWLLFKFDCWLSLPNFMGAYLRLAEV